MTVPAGELWAWSSPAPACRALRPLDPPVLKVVLKGWPILGLHPGGVGILSGLLPVSRLLLTDDEWEGCFPKGLEPKGPPLASFGLGLPPGRFLQGDPKWAVDRGPQKCLQLAPKSSVPKLGLQLSAPLEP